MALGINIIDSIKSALRAAADVGDKYSSFNTKSVARGALEQSFLFPVLMDSTVPVDLGTTVTRNLDRVYASWTQIYLSSIGFIDLNYIKNPRQFIAKYQPKFQLESADEAEEELTAFSEGYDESLYALYGDSEMMFTESGKDCNVTALITPGGRASRSMMEAQKKAMTPYLDGINRRGLNDSFGTKSFTEASSDDDDIFTGLLTNTARNEMQKQNNERLKAERDARTPKMSESDAKHINDMQPYMIDLKLLASKGDSSFSQWVNFTVGVKAFMHLASSDALAKNILYILKNKNPVFNFIRWTTGEISLMKDIILHLNDINFDVANKSDKTGKFINSLKRLKKKYVKVGTFGVNKIAPFATIVISSSTYRYIRDEFGFDLKNPAFSHKIMEELFLMCFVIIDDVNHTVDMLVDGQSDYQTYSLEMLEREVTMNSNKLGKELTRMLGSGM